MFGLNSIAEIRQGLESIAENTLNQTAAYNGTIIVNVLESIMRTSQKTITIGTNGKQAKPKQIIFYRQDTAEEDAQIKFALALKFAEVFCVLFNQKYAKAPLEPKQLSDITIREKSENGHWGQRQVSLIALNHSGNANLPFMRRSAFYYQSISEGIIEAFVEIIQARRNQTQTD